MFKKTNVIDILICLQALVISTMIPVFITLPFDINNIQIIELPITWQIPLIIIISLVYRNEIVITSYTVYIFIGLFFLPIFHQGGSLGYLLTPNFGYLLGSYALIKIVGNLKNNNSSITLFNFIKTCTSGIFIMHIIGIAYLCFQMLYTKQVDSLFYNISKYTLGKFGYHFLMLMPITLILRKINSLSKNK